MQPSQEELQGAQAESSKKPSAKDDIQVKFCKLGGGIVKEISWLVFILEEMEVQERHGKFRTLSLAVDSVFGGWTSVRN
jgi:hypothetical protein